MRNRPVLNGKERMKYSQFKPSSDDGPSKKRDMSMISHAQRIKNKYLNTSLNVKTENKVIVFSLLGIR